MKRKSTSSSSSNNRPGAGSIRLPSPEMAAAVCMRGMLDRQSTDPDPDPEEIARDLEEQGKIAASGDATLVRRALAAQVTTLERLFHHFMQLAAEEKPGSDPHDRLSRLALRAQIQSARTGTMLARLCNQMNPPAEAKGEPPQPARERTPTEELNDYFLASPLSKALAKHDDPDINFYTKKPRLKFEPGSALHDLFESATCSEIFAKALDDMLHGKIPWPDEGGPVAYARRMVAEQRKADALGWGK